MIVLPGLASPVMILVIVVSVGSLLAFAIIILVLSISVSPAFVAGFFISLVVSMPTVVVFVSASSTSVRIFLLLSCHIVFHRVLIVFAVLFDGQSFFATDSPSPLLSSGLVLALSFSVTGPLCTSVPLCLQFGFHSLNPPRILILVVSLLVPRMINPQHATQHLSTGQIIHRQITTPLIFILQEAKALGFTGLAVPDEIEVCRIAKLREDGDDIAFAKVQGDATDVDPGCIFVVGMPGCRRGCCVFEFTAVELLGLANCIHGAEDKDVAVLGRGIDSLHCRVLSSVCALLGENLRYLVPAR